MSNKKPQTKLVARSAKTGLFVTTQYAKTHKSTTEMERVRVPKKK